MFKQVIQVDSPGGADAREVGAGILFAGNLEDAKAYLAICDDFVERGDIWFTHVGFNDDGSKIKLTRIFDSEDAYNSFNDQVQHWRADWNITDITVEEITFEEFADFAAEHEEIVPLDIPEE
jgi:hypothetical protein